MTTVKIKARPTAEPVFCQCDVERKERTAIVVGADET